MAKKKKTTKTRIAAKLIQQDVKHKDRQRANEDAIRIVRGRKRLGLK